MRPELPDAVVVQVWPAGGDCVFHPDDLELAKAWIPSSRVFLRSGFDGKYYHLRYGDQSLRMAPCLITKVPLEDLQVGDRVEVLTLLLERDPVLAEVIEKRWDQEKQQIVYENDPQRGPSGGRMIGSDADDCLPSFPSIV